MKDRDETIDFLRGFSIVLIITIHVFSSYLQLYPVFLMWNYLHFVELLIIFCSGASLYYAHRIFKNVKEVRTFIKKRLERLYIPWWIFLSVYLTVTLTFDLISSGKFRYDIEYLIRSFFLFGIDGGLAYGWILLAILLLSLCYPILNYLLNKYEDKRFFIVFFCFFALLNLFRNYLAPWIIYLNYLIPFYFGISYAKNKKIPIKLLLIFGVIYAYYFITIPNHAGSLMLTENKWPPNPLFISYGMIVTGILVFIISKFASKVIIKNNVMQFISKNSLWIYQWHILLLGIVYLLFSSVTTLLLIQELFLKWILIVTISVCLVIIQQLIAKKLGWNELIKFL